jgi:hypothetical protein
MYELNMWKWLVPAGMVPLLGGAAMWLAEFGGGFVYCSAALVGLMLILAMQGWAGFRAYFREVESVQFERKRRALAETPEARMAEALRGLHPQTVMMILNYQKSVWLIDAADVNGLCEWHLRDDPRVNARFMQWVLENSNDYSIMPAHGRISDKAFTWSKTVSDRDMYKALSDLLVRKGILTEAYGNQPGFWNQPWNPVRVGKRWGLMLGEEEEAVESEQLAVGSG